MTLVNRPTSAWLIDRACIDAGTDEEPPRGLPMTPERIDFCLSIIGWSSNDLAYRLNRNDRSIRRWLSGARPMPDEVGLWLEAVREALLEIPLPADWPLQR